jgi:hypothetical protein
MRFPLLLLAVASFAAPRPADVPFKKLHLDGGANETAAFADLSGDGKLDVVNGEHWYEQPKVKGGEWKKHRFRELEFLNNYIDAFTDIPLDVNGDGRIDIVTCMWFGKKIAWYENPGRMGAPWKEHIIEDQWNVEFMFLVDLNNDGKEQELLPQFGGRGPTAWYELKGGKFVRHIVHPDNFGHGIGAGDINKDGRNDILTPRGWLEAPANPTAEGQWALHQDWTAKKHTGFLHVVDINGDGRNDVFYPHAHDYGIYWLRQEADGRWTEFKIDDAWSQAHATAFVDINGDGQKDFIAGKRFLAHDHDPGAQEPLGIYWYEWRKSGNNIEWIRHVIDYSSSAGAGMQIAVADYDGDGDLDFAVGGKSGAFLFENTSPKKGPAK